MLQLCKNASQHFKNSNPPKSGYAIGRCYKTWKKIHSCLKRVMQQNKHVFAAYAHVQHQEIQEKHKAVANSQVPCSISRVNLKKTRIYTSML
jgi:hypothetical protein